MKLERVARNGRVFDMQWDNGIYVHVSRIREQRNGDWRGQVTFFNGDVPLHCTVMNFCIDSSRNSTVRTLLNMNGTVEIPWDSIVQQMSYSVKGEAVNPI
jgi:hypothetical protein